MQVLYGTDIPQPEYDDGAPRPAHVLAATRTRTGVCDAVLARSLVRHSPLIPGVNYPMFYVGMRNSFFCWHVEVRARRRRALLRAVTRAHPLPAGRARVRCPSTAARGRAG